MVASVAGTRSSIWLSAPAGRSSLGVEKVLQSIGNAMEWAEVDAAADQRVRRVRLRQRPLGCDRGETFEPWSQCVDPGEVNLRQPPARQSARANPGREFSNRREGDVRLIFGNGRTAALENRGEPGAGMRKFGRRGSKRLAVGIELSKRNFRRAIAEAIWPSRFSTIWSRSAAV